MYPKQARPWQRRLYLFSSFALGAATLAGCVGQKYSFPGFGTKQASKIEAPSKTNSSAVKSETGLNHVAQQGTETNPTLGQSSEIHPASAIEFDQSAPGTVRITSAANQPSVSEVNKAFQARMEETTGLPQISPDPKSDTQTLITQNTQAESPLEALKNSLNRLNDAPPKEAMPKSDSKLSFSDYMLAQQNQSEPSPTVTPPVEQASASASMSEKKTNNKFAMEFPWDNSSEEPQTPAGNAEPSQIRTLLSKARKLVLQNKLLDARIVAESARALKEKTESVFLPEEVTPEQILAEIAERERQRKETLLAQYAPEKKSSVKPSSPVQLSSHEQNTKSPVVIDLSKEWINSTQNNSINSTDDITSFDQATSRPNHPAQLPMITPSQERFPRIPESSYQEPSYSSSESALPVQENLGIEENNSVPMLTFPGTDGLVNNEPHELRQSNTSDDLITFLPGENQSLELRNQQREKEILTGDAPLLIAPSVTNEVAPPGNQNTEIDEFANDFADVTVTDNLELQEAPLLIDEAELNTDSKRSSAVSTPTLAMLIGGVFLASLLIIRWRR